MQVYPFNEDHLEIYLLERTYRSFVHAIILNHVHVYPHLDNRPLT